MNFFDNPFVLLFGFSSYHALWFFFFKSTFSSQWWFLKVQEKKKIFFNFQKRNFMAIQTFS